ncbi:MAG TPA: Stk1 family PASTA domain-containing Ser/Thr kinase [Mycobacteriales bacterium]|nr:Stk1 family PASTA domain-containing Ser/Thr kinase [Mycobacteriales bacterium]HWB65869.1 Stk1 family PASTA domain-containing Ser/Thr kinase [Mycobacteriales bacterium]
MDATPGDPMLGRLLDGRYAVEAFIAHGGMASVYLATDNRLERRVAVKVMHAHLADDPETAARFQREARSAARLSHPDIVAVYDQGTEGGRAFLVMEYVAGANLREVLRDRGRLRPGQAVAVMDHMLAALAAAHRAGLVHRDVKPENVLVTADGRVKVADFGLARAVSGTTVTTTGAILLGTAAYLAPEQFEDGVADERSDVYSAGIVLYEMLTGAPPYSGDSALAVLRRHVTEAVPAPSARASEIPPQLDALVTWATSRDPRQRPANAGEFHASLVDVRDRLALHDGVPGLPVAATSRIGAASTAVLSGPPSTQIGDRPDDTLDGLMGGGPPPPGRVRRRRGPWLLLALVAAIAAAVVLGWWFAVGRYTHTPSLLNKTKSVAETQLKAAGLHVKWLPSVHSATVKAGRVASESPGPGDRIGNGGTVKLRLSLGPVTHPVPRTAGDTVGQAQDSLRALDLHVKQTVHRFSTSVAKGRVVGTEPGANTTVNAGDGVTLIVSKGPQLIPVPPVDGQSAKDAIAALHGADFAVNRVDAFNDQVPAGQVISSSPRQGHNAAKGSTITLTVSKGPQLVAVPNVDGLPIGQAVRRIHDAGFNPNPKLFAPGGPQQVFRYSPSSPQPKGTTIELDYY